MKHIQPFGKNQSGAALVVGMLLLMVLTLLSVSAMNTASLELTMAGNIQAQEKTFQMAERGIEKPISSPTRYFIPKADPDTYNDASTACGGGMISSGDSNSCERNEVTITTLDPEGSPTLSSSGNSLTKMVDYHFQISSTANTESGNAKTNHVQIVVKLSPASG